MHGKPTAFSVSMALALWMSPGPAAAQVSPALAAQVEELIDESVESYKLVLTCSVLDADRHPRIVRDWDWIVEESAVVLGEIGFDDTYVAAFRARAAVENSLMHLTLSEAVTYCGSWQRDVDLLLVPILHFELNRLLTNPG